jgi:hypothetical protein
MGATSHRPPKSKPPTDRPGPVDGVTPDRPAPKSLDDRLDEALEETFPASDPPAVHSYRRPN